MDAGHLQSKQPRSPLAGSYGHPVHPHPGHGADLGAWVCSLVFDVVSFVSSEPRTWSTGVDVPILLGAIGAVVAAILGGIDLRGLPHGSAALKTGRIHAGLNSTATGIFVGGFDLALCQPGQLGVRADRSRESRASSPWPWWAWLASSVGNWPITTAYASPTSRSRLKGSGQAADGNSEQHLLV